MKKCFMSIVLILLLTLLTTNLALAYNTPKIKADPNWLEQANQIAGTNVWVKSRCNIYSNSFNTFTNLEEVAVLEIKREISIFDDYNGTETGYKLPKYIIKIQKSDGTICTLGNILEINYFYEVKELFYTENPYEKYSWSDYAWDLIRNNKICIGMNQDQTIMAWGNPKDINKNVGIWGVFEQWIYWDQYLYFNNGFLTSFQN